MAYYIVKVVVTAVIIVLVTEVSKRDTFFGGLIASLPLVSYLSFIWLYVETSDTARISELSMQIFWLVIPSLIFFVIFSMMVKTGFGFAISMSLSTAVMLSAYGVALYFLKFAQ